jgi:hypothetical protein
VGEGALDVTWMEGGGVRNERIDARMGKGRKLISWKDTISKDSIILYDIEQTKTNRHKVEYLKEQYLKLCT